MKRWHDTFLEYRIYRKKFLGTVAVVLLLSTAVFSGMLVFLTNTWIGQIRQEEQNRFLDKERRLGSIQTWTLAYANKLYENKYLMQDLKSLFTSPSASDYLQQRRQRSLGSRAQIIYAPADMKKLFWDSRSKITGITLRSESGLKVLWMEGNTMHVSFDFQVPEDVEDIPGFGDMKIASYAIRDPQNMGNAMGYMDFWISSENIYESNEQSKTFWGVFDKEGRLLTDNLQNEKQENWLSEASQKGIQSGWMRNKIRLVYFLKFTSSQNSFSYVAAKDIFSMLKDNRYTVLALSSAFVLIGVGTLVFTYLGIRADRDFLSTIMKMLTAMENGNFEKMQKYEIPMQDRENEYGTIAVALKEVGMKLKGYIETEYILKLKEQETQMRALQHQINPHFLYNTLETLRSKALLGGEHDIADAIAMLGTLYRARMHKKDFIPLAEEFELLEMYLKIMSLRFGDNFVYQVELDKEIADIPTVTFWLQPLAENFFVHGYDQESLYNLLIVSGHAEKGGARIEIIDNGSGVSPALLEETGRNMEEGNDDPEADIGLRNVYMRLKYFYRDGFTMKIGNNAEGGFCVSIFIPRKVDENVHISDRG